MAQILLTGATGFVGDALLPALVNDGHSLSLFHPTIAKAAKRFSDARRIDSLDYVGHRS